MNNIQQSTLVKKMKRQYSKLYNALSKAQIQLQKEQKTIGCFSCDYYFQEKEKPFEQRYAPCKSCSKGKNMIQAYMNTVNASKMLDNFINNEYSKVVFDLLNDTKPDLLVRQTGNTIKWEEAFPKAFSELLPGHKSSLIALIEENGGRYRIKQ